METRTDSRLGLGGMRRGRGATMGGRGLSHISRCGGEAERISQNAFRYLIRGNFSTGYASTLLKVEHGIAGFQEWRGVRDYLLLV